MSVANTFAWLSDIHYDPFYGSSQAFGNNDTCKSNTQVPFYGCDSPWQLIENAISALADQSPLFVLVTGDFARHGMDQLPNSSMYMADILSKVTLELQRKLEPETTILPLLGNNDVIPDYYIDIADKKHMKIFSDTFLNLSVISNDEAEQLSNGGYYGRTMGNFRILCLNTVIYSIAHQPKLPNYNNDPFDQFTWMEIELQQHDNIYLIGHIPPTISSYFFEDMWEERYRKIYESLTEKYSSKIRMQLFGHFHSNEFRMHGKNLTLFLGPSITPVYNNNPAFQIVHFDASDGALVDIETFIYNLSDSVSDNWTKLSSFRQHYGLEDMLRDGIKKGILDPMLKKNETVLRQFLFSYKYGTYSRSMQLCLSRGIDACSRQWYCILTSNSQASYNVCQRGEQRNMVLSENAMLVLICSIALMSSIAIISCLRKRYGRGINTYHSPGVLA
jgi:sphingomyelin phosphodiesterase acid-like 3